MKGREAERLEHVQLVTRLAERIIRLQAKLSASEKKAEKLRKKLGRLTARCK